MKNTSIYFMLAVILCGILSSCDSTTPSTQTPIGDVGNDLQLINGKLFIVMDNSDKIVVGTPPASSDYQVFILNQGAFGKNNSRLDSWDWTNSTFTVGLFTTDGSSDHSSITFPAKSAPWKILQISPTEALAAEYYTNNLAVINLTSNTISSTIPIGAGQNSLAVLGNTVYATTNSNTIVSLDKTAKTIISQKYIGDNPGQVFVDSAHNSLIVFTTGNYSPKTPGKILWVNPTTLAVTDSITVDTTHYINEIVSAGSKAYVLFTDKVQVLDLGTHALSTDGLFAKIYYGGYFDPVANYLYMGTAVDFQSNDIVDVFDLSAHSLKRTMNVGIAPSFFAVTR